VIPAATWFSGQILDAIGCDLPNEDPTAIARWSQRNIESFGDWDYRKQAASVRCPILVIHGSSDNIPLSASWEWATVLPSDRLLVLPEVGHYPFYECSARFIRAADAFVAGGWPGGAVAVSQ
jgi:pimeloyl-ACP methyl ester carboxylesterase